MVLYISSEFLNISHFICALKHYFVLILFLFFWLENFNFKFPTAKHMDVIDKHAQSLTQGKIMALSTF